MCRLSTQVVTGYRRNTTARRLTRFTWLCLGAALAYAMAASAGPLSSGQRTEMPPNGQELTDTSHRTSQRRADESRKGPTPWDSGDSYESEEDCE